MIRVSRPAMGSVFEIYLGGEEVEACERDAYAALDRVNWLEQQLSHYLPDSDICQINARAFEEAVPVGPSLFALLLRLRQLSLETEGAFDCTAGKLVRAWGFFRRGQARGEQSAPPEPETLARIAQQIGWRNVELDDATQTIRFLTPEVELHLGAVGKGYIVQCAADYLRSLGYTQALLHSGQSSIVAIGAPPDSEGWPIGIAAQADGEARVVAYLRDAALSTSGSAEQFVTIQGVRYSHIFDPRAGTPVSGVESVTVLSQNALDGDALSTAFTVQGVEWTRAYCQNHPKLGAWFAPSDSSAPIIPIGV